MKQDHQGKLILVTTASGPEEDKILSLVHEGGFKVFSCGIAAGENGQCEWSCDLRWRATLRESTVPHVVRRLGAMTGVTRVSWTRFPDDALCARPG